MRPRARLALAAAFLGTLLLAGCSVVGPRVPPRLEHAPPPAPPPAPLPGPPPGDLLAIPDAVPRVEPRARLGNPPFYNVLGHRYYVLASAEGYVAGGVASWYGPTFHGVRTAVGEPY